MRQNVVFRVISPERVCTGFDGSVRRFCEAIVAWSELGTDGQPHEQRLLCTIWGKTLERIQQLKPTPNDAPMMVSISMTTATGKDSNKVFNRIHLYLDDCMPE